jgi:uncharacterized membrane protein (UPF0127 family)
MVDRALVVAVAAAMVAAVAFVSLGLSPDTGARVVVEGENGTRLGAVSVTIADDPQERYTGLSDTESLGANEGMLFVYESPGRHTYVMRSMDFPIDIVYVAANGSITRIHHATVEADNENLTPYPGYGQYVLEVPYNWTVKRGVSVGDRVTVPANVSDTPSSETR